MDKEKKEEKQIQDNLFFTEITENEKRIINLIRTYVAPLGSVSDFIDFLVDNTAHKLLEKTIRLQAFVEVMQHERNNKSDIQIMARMNQFEDFLFGDKTVVNRYMTGIYTDMINNLEGPIKPIDVYSKLDNLEEEEKSLDKIQN